MTSPIFVVDADIFILIQRAHLEERIAGLGRLPIVVTAIVWDELVGPAADQRRVVALKKMLEAIAGEPTDFEPETEEALAFAQLQLPPPTEGVGEHSVIAHAITHPATVAVLNDKRAVHRAVEELAGRVVSVHGFLAGLHRAEKLDVKLAREISDEYCRRYTPARPPLWWSSLYSLAHLS